MYSFDLIYVQACSRPYICTVLTLYMCRHGVDHIYIVLTLYMCRHGVDLIYAVFDLIYVQVDLIYLTLDLIYQILTIYLKTDFCPIWRVIGVFLKPDSSLETTNTSSQCFISLTVTKALFIGCKQQTIRQSQDHQRHILQLHSLVQQLIRRSTLLKLIVIQNNTTYVA